MYFSMCARSMSRADVGSPSSTRKATKSSATWRYDTMVSGARFRATRYAHQSSTRPEIAKLVMVDPTLFEHRTTVRMVCGSTFYLLVRPAGFEPATLGLEVLCSIH